MESSNIAGVGGGGWIIRCNGDMPLDGVRFSCPLSGTDQNTISEFIGLNVVSSIHLVIIQVYKMSTWNDQRLYGQLNRPRV